MVPKKTPNRKKPENLEKANSVSNNPPETYIKSIEDPSADFPVVALGASAGGLEALEEFFSHVPEHSGLAFVIVQHLEVTGASTMPEILSRFTAMPARVATNGLPVSPNAIYLIPPSKNMGIRRGALFLEEPSKPADLRQTVDFFFSSLAVEKGHHCLR